MSGSSAKKEGTILPVEVSMELRPEMKGSAL
jgi:hypothetical protein